MRTHTKLLSLFFSCTSLCLQAQCPITVNAGPDQFVCTPGATATLAGSITGNYLGFNWSPTAGLSNANTLSPSLPVTGPATYTLTASAADPNAPNLVTNPGFEAGNTGFSSTYTYTPTPITPGTWFIATSPSIVWTSLPPCDDHTFANGTGQMMLLNGTGTPGAGVWCQTIPVTPNTWYSMSAWTMTTPIAPAQLQFSVNGTPVGSLFQPGSGVCLWQQWSAGWFSGSATSAVFCVDNHNTSGNGLFGDDFALDDLYFGAACTVTDQVSVGVVTVNATLPAVTTLPCSAAVSGIVLNGSGSTSGANISYGWTTIGGNILSGQNSPNATVNAPGTYTLTVTFSNGGTVCTDQASIEVLPDPNPVAAFVGTPPSPLNCNNPTLTLDGSPSSSGAGVTYSWTYQPSSGGIPPGVVSGGNTAMPTVNQPGFYTLTVSGPTGCTATTTANVFANFTQPLAAASASGQITCANSTLTLNGTGSTAGANYLWATANGTISSGANTLNNCVVSAPGTYVLTVTHAVSGCTASASVTVSGNLTAPTAVAAASDTIFCNQATVQLSGVGSSAGANFNYNWTPPPGGAVTAGQGTLAPTVNAAGVYTLTVVNQQNGCTATATATVLSNTTPPTALAAAPQAITCTNSSVLLSGTGSSSGANFNYQWSGGSITAGGITLNPTVNAAGTYTLTVTNAQNGCTATATATVATDTLPPLAEAGASITLDCDSPSAMLDGTGSSTGVNFSYDWTTPLGGGAGGVNTLNPSVGAPGIYTLTVTNAQNGCTAADSVEVFASQNLPVAVAAVSGQLDCLHSSLSIETSGSSSGASFAISWSFFPPPGGGTGGVIPGQTAPSLVVTAPGTYVFSLENTLNNCIANDTVIVVENVTLPLADAGQPDTLTCLSPSAMLDGSGSSTGANFIYAWTFPAGGGATTLDPVVSEAGTYTLTVANLQNGCTATDVVLVLSDTLPPVAEAGAAVTLDCDSPSAMLDGSGSSSGSNFSYAWTTPLGGGAGGVTLPVNAPGTYLLTVTNPQNGCTAVDSVLVSASQNLPLAVAAVSGQLDCQTTSLNLDAGGSSGGAGINLFWQFFPEGGGAGGTIPGENSPALLVTAPGTYILWVENAANNCAASDTALVFQDLTPPFAEAGTGFTLSCGATSATLDGSQSSSGGSGFSYLWTTPLGGGAGGVITGETTLTPQVNASGIYTLTVTNLQNGCTATDEVSILQDADAPLADAGLPDTLTCLLTTLSLDASNSAAGAGISYLWTFSGAGIGVVSGENSLTPVVNEPGIYTLTVFNSMNNCQSVSSVQIFENAEPPIAEAGAGGELTCTLAALTLDGGGSSQGSQFSYAWTYPPGGGAGGVTLNPTVNLPGTYTLSVSNLQTGCTAVDFTEITADTLAPMAVAASVGQLTCLQNTATLDGAGSSLGANFSYSWTGAGGIVNPASLNASANAPGTYTLTVNDLQNGCTAAASAEVTQDTAHPVIIFAQAEMLTCTIAEVALDASGSLPVPAGIFWSSPTGNFGSGTTTLSPSVNAAGEYILQLTDPGNGCQSLASVFVGQDLVPPSANAGQDASLDCSTPKVELHVTTNSPPVANFWWEFLPEAGVVGEGFVSGQMSPAPWVNLPGWYAVTVTNPDNGCTASDTVLVSSVILEDFSFEKNDPDCLGAGGSIEFTAVQGGTAPYLFSIDSGATFSSELVFENLQAAVHELVVLDAGGCELVETAVELSAPSPFTVTLPGTLEVDAGASVSLDPVLSIPENEVDSIAWSPAEGLSCSDCLHPLAAPSEDAVYSLVVTGSNGCTAGASVQLLVQKETQVFVPNVFSPNGDGVNERLTLYASASVTEVLTFKIFSRWGELMFDARHFSPNEQVFGWDGTFRGKEMDGGVYAWFAEVELADGSRKFLEGEVMLLR